MEYHGVATLTTGEIFGEKGLDDNIPRNATIICSENCQFGLLDKEDYSKILKDISRLRKDKIKDFIHRKTFKKKISKVVSDKLAYDFSKFVFEVKRGEDIIKQGSRPDDVFIVETGTVMIYRTEIIIKKKFKYKLMAPTKVKREFDISVIGEGEIFGDYCYVSSKERFFGARMIEKGTIMKVSKESLMNHMMNYRKLYDYIIDKAKEKHNFRLEILKEKLEREKRIVLGMKKKNEIKIESVRAAKEASKFKSDSSQTVAPENGLTTYYTGFYQARSKESVSKIPSPESRKESVKEKKSKVEIEDSIASKIGIPKRFPTRISLFKMIRTDILRNRGIDLSKLEKSNNKKDESFEDLFQYKRSREVLKRTSVPHYHHEMSKGRAKTKDTTKNSSIFMGFVKQKRAKSLVDKETFGLKPKNPSLVSSFCESVYTTGGAKKLKKFLRDKLKDNTKNRKSNPSVNLGMLMTPRTTKDSGKIEFILNTQEDEMKK